MSFMADVFSIRERLVFSAETAAPGTVSDVPSAGHCAAAAIIIQMLVGGELVSARFCDQSHWFNRIDGWDVDVTADQFKGNPVIVARANSLYPDTRVRQHSEINKETWDRARILAKNSNIQWSYDETFLLAT